MRTFFNRSKEAFLFSLILILSLFFFAYTANATYTGSIAVCKAILDESGSFLSSDDVALLPYSSFEISILKGDDYFTATDLYTASFDTGSFFPDTDIFLNDGIDDVQCVYYDDLEIAEYFYEEEQLTSTGSQWSTPLYNDQYSSTVYFYDDFYDFSPEVFNHDPTDDHGRNLNSDGNIILTKQRADRVLVVLNKHPFTPLPIYQCSDEIDNGDGDNLSDEEDPTCHTDGDAGNPSSYDPTIDNENTKPVLHLTGSSTVYILQGDAYFDDGATATDQEDDDIILTAAIVVGGDIVDTGALGTYIITYNVTDSAAAAADQVLRAVIVEEKYECNDGITNDNDSLVDEDDPACHTDNNAGNPSSYDPTIDNENEKPLISVQGADPLTIVIGSAFLDPGAVADDAEDGDITSSIIIGGDAVATSTVGTYVITYNVTDSDGSAADQKTRTVNIVEQGYQYQCSDEIDNGDGDNLSDEEDPTCHTDGDAGNPSSYDPTIDNENTKPVLHLTGSSTVYILQGDAYFDDGATATDQEDDDIILTAAIVVGGDIVDTNTTGTYTIRYNVTDSAGAHADEVTRDVIVEEDEVYECNDEIDNDEDELVDSEDPTCHTDGDAGNPSSYDPTIDDESESDNTKPVITLIGGSTITLTVGGSFSDPGANADDAEDGDISDDIVKVGSVNAGAVGTYTITYNVADSEGLAADEVVRTVFVKSGGGGGGGGTAHECSDKKDNDGDGFTDYPDDKGCTFSDDDSENDAPKITLLGNGIMTILEGAVFLDPGVTAFDVEDGDITSEVIVGGDEVSSSTPVGFYTITYNVSDSQGMAAPQVTREVIVEIGGVGGGPSSQCSDGIDNDGDGFSDYPSDPGCDSAGDNDEYDAPVVIEEIPEAPQQCNYLLEYLRINKDNNPVEVRKLQVFLRDYEGFSDLLVTGVFDQATFDAVSSFQLKYKDEVLIPWGSPVSTGYVYITTKKKVNEIYCNSEFPLTQDQINEINDFKERLTVVRDSQPVESREDVVVDIEVEVENIEVVEEIKEGSEVVTPDGLGGDSVGSITPEQEGELDISNVVGLSDQATTSTEDLFAAITEDVDSAPEVVNGLANVHSMVDEKISEANSRDSLSVTSRNFGDRVVQNNIFWIIVLIFSTASFFYFRHRKDARSDMEKEE